MVCNHITVICLSVFKTGYYWVHNNMQVWSIGTGVHTSACCMIYMACVSSW